MVSRPIQDRHRGAQVFENMLQVNKGLRFDSNTETLAGTKTLVFGDAVVQFLDPGGAGRTVILPAEADSNGLVFIIANRADAAEVLTIQDDGTATVCTPTEAETALVICDGTTWVGLVGASS